MGRYACTENMRLNLESPVWVACLLAGLTACVDPPRATGEEEIVIGVIAPVASSQFRSGPPTVEGAAMAAREINAGGGLDLGGRRRRIRLVVEDTEDRPETAVSKAFKLIGSDRAVALVGLPISDSALAVAKVAQEHRVPLISTMSSNPETTRGKSFAFRVIFDDPFQGRILAEFAYRDLGARRAGVLFNPGRAYSRGLKQEFRASFEGLGGELVSEESFTVDDSDATDQLLGIRRSGADVLILPMYEALLSPLMRQARTVGITVPVLGGDSWSNLTAVERTGWGPSYFSDVWALDAPGPVSRRFIDAYRDEYGKPATSYAALAYDAIFLVARAIESPLRGAQQASRDDAAPESIQAGLLSLRGFIGVTGSIRYEGSGDPLRSAVIMRLADDGSAHLHRKLDP